MSLSIPKIIPIFPLPNVVLFPRIQLPLHIFEPRYRQMIKDILPTDRIIGMALFKEGWKDHYGQHPNIYSLGGLGKITGCQNLEDGRYNILLSGIARYRIIEELYDRPYRQAWVEPVLPTPPQTALSLKNRKEINRLIHQELNDKPGISTAIATLQRADDETLIHALSSSLKLTPLEKQFLLEAEDLNQQCRRLLDIIHLQQYSIRDKA